jgi:16S rRNA G966 N2-methylase RsmD
MQNSSFNNFLGEGKLNIFNEDALDFLPKLESESIDLIYCDLPFGTTQCSWDEVIPFDKMWEQVIRIAKQNTPIVFHAQQPFTSALIMSNPKMFKYTWVWEKSKATGFLNAKKTRLPFLKVALRGGFGPHSVLLKSWYRPAYFGCM